MGFEIRINERVGLCAVQSKTGKDCLQTLRKGVFRTKPNS